MSKLENDITMRMLAGEITYEQGQRALRDPASFRVTQRMADGQRLEDARYRYWGKVKTPRMRVGFCWSTQRNEAGYFLGWRELYSPTGKRIGRDQFTARKTKVRLKEQQLRKTKALIDQGGKTSPRNKENVEFWAKKILTETVDD